MTASSSWPEAHFPTLSLLATLPTLCTGTGSYLPTLTDSVRQLYNPDQLLFLLQPLLGPQTTNVTLTRPMYLYLYQHLHAYLRVYLHLYLYAYLRVY